MAMLFFVMAIFFDVFVSVLQGLRDLEGPAPSSDVRQLADDPIWDALHVVLQAKAPPCMDPVLLWNSPAHHTGHEMAAEVRPAVLGELEPKWLRDRCDVMELKWLWISKIVSVGCFGSRFI